ncbi:hypothetical protein R5R35_011825 [Gryllus longicercus]|uniref:26S proteasome non-ATPase regulatory subunit 5 n=1 Tax=Gryllus longicercus TaxID=2509291 RepID=A0AAN9ZHM2_9ORTH|nr:26S proteasome non-ATPase regulatory subunit 5 [Gryllus bimaculatus]
MANFEWFESKVSELRSDNERAQVLSELKLAVSSQNVSQQKYIAQNLQLDAVFDCLNSSESEEIDSACHVLSLLLGSLDPSVVLRQYLDHLQRALGHPTASVKEMSIAELRRVACSGDLVHQLCQNDLILNIVTCLSNDDIAVAKNACTLLVKLGESSTGLKVLFSREILEALRKIQKQSDIIRFRVFEMAVLIAEHSPEGQQACVSSGLLPALVEELQTEDVLLQLNALELLTKLALKPHGLEWLQHRGILRQLAEKVNSIEEEPLGSLLLPGLIKFFGNLAQSNPKEFFNEYPRMVAALFETFDTSDMVLLGVAMETIGYIATSVEGKYMLYNLGDLMKKAIKKISNGIQSFPHLSRVRALNTMANIIELKLDAQETQSLQITKEFFNWLSEEPMTLVMSVCQQPFPELRLAGVQVLKVLAEQEWGQELIKKQPGVVEFLLDRRMETHKYCKDAKYEVVKVIVESPTGLSVFGSETFTRLREFFKEGPFFVQTQTEVAIEGAS